MSTYWIVNLRTKQYFICSDDGTFFDGDWKKKTPWPDEQYVNLTAQKVWLDQVFSDGAFYGYDLCRNGMLVGVYFDSAVFTRTTIQPHILQLKRQHDVASVFYHSLTKVEGVINA